MLKISVIPFETRDFSEYMYMLLNDIAHLLGEKPAKQAATGVASNCFVLDLLLLQAETGTACAHVNCLGLDNDLAICCQNDNHINLIY